MQISKTRRLFHWVTAVVGILAVAVPLLSNHFSHRVYLVAAMTPEAVEIKSYFRDEIDKIDSSHQRFAVLAFVCGAVAGASICALRLSRRRDESQKS